MDKQKSTTITQLNVFCTILIVLLHCKPSTYGLYSIIWTITDIAVPTFFMISSYLYFNTFSYREGVKSYLSKLKKRTFSLLVPYLIFTSLGAALLAIKGVIRQEISSLDMFLNDIIQGVITGTGNPPLWYLKSLFIFAFFAPLLGLIVRWSKYSILLYPFSMLLCFHFGYSNILHWIPCLLVGCHLATYPVQYKFSRHTRLWFMIAAVLYFVLFSFYFYNVKVRSGLVGGYIYRMSSF